MTGSEFANAPLLSLTTRMQRSTAHQWQAFENNSPIAIRILDGEILIDANDEHEWKRRRMQKQGPPKTAQILA
jgi:hypothetical protein